MIARWKSAGKTILITEHRLYYLKNLADRIIYMKNGKICNEYTPSELEGKGTAVLQQMGLRPMSMETLSLPPSPSPFSTCSYVLKNFIHAYPGTASTLNIPDLSVPNRSIVALVGHNGAGKTTFARLLSGLSKKCKGLLCSDNHTMPAKTRLKHVYMVMQDVNHQLFTESVLDEVLLSMPNPDEIQAAHILSSLDLWTSKDKHPMSLSGGEKQRLAIASAIASDREIILFDEPTSGLDLKHMQQVAVLLRNLKSAEKTVFVISHDPELILACCDYVIQIADGRVKRSYPLTEENKQQLLSFFFPSNHSELPSILPIHLVSKIVNS
jgi:energy-coupling factor transport system ATP-binding protein